MEQVPCEVCGSDERQFAASRRDLFLGGDAVYSMYHCQGCGVVYQYPRPTPQTIGHFYPSQYQQYTPGVNTESWLRRLDRRYGLRKRCQIVVKHVAAGRLLDIGCATGDFLSEMKRYAGWTVFGLETSSTAAAYAHAAEGVPVVNAIPNTSPFANGSFDAITMWDVLEHVHDPRAVIQEVVRLLRPGGVFVVNHPNWDSIDRRLFNSFWLGYELPRHLYLFPPKILRKIMAEYGFEEVELRCLYGSNAASSTSLTLMAKEALGEGLLSRVVDKVLFSKITRLLLLPYFKIIDDRHLGSNVTAVFRKAITDPVQSNHS